LPISIGTAKWGTA